MNSSCYETPRSTNKTKKRGKWVYGTKKKHDPKQNNATFRVVSPCRCRPVAIDHIYLYVLHVGYMHGLAKRAMGMRLAARGHRPPPRGDDEMPLIHVQTGAPAGLANRAHGWGG
jgi:hypothetical protein